MPATELLAPDEFADLLDTPEFKTMRPAERAAVFDAGLKDSEEWLKQNNAHDAADWQQTAMALGNRYRPAEADIELDQQGPLGTAVNAFKNLGPDVVHGVVGGVAKMADAASEMVGLSDPNQPSWMDRTADLTEDLVDEGKLIRPTNPANPTAATIGSGAGQAVALLGTAGASLPLLGARAMTAVPAVMGFAMGAGSGIDTAEEMGITSPAAKLGMGAAFGTIEGATEMIGGIGGKFLPTPKGLAGMAMAPATEGAEEMLSQGMQDATTAGVGQLVSDPNRPGYTQSGYKLPQFDADMWERQKQSAIGGAAGGAVFAGLQLAQPQNSNDNVSTNQTAASNPATSQVPAQTAPLNPNTLAQIAARGGAQDVSQPRVAAGDTIVAAAVLQSDGSVATGRTHRQADAAAPEQRDARETPDFGFVAQGADGTQRFVSRAEALQIAQTNGQLHGDADVGNGLLHSDQLDMPADASTSNVNASAPTLPSEPIPAAAANAPPTVASVAADVPPAAAPFTTAATPAPEADIRVAADEAPRVLASRPVMPASQQRNDAMAAAAAALRGQQPSTTANNRQPLQTAPAAVPSDLLAAAHAAAMQGSSTPMVPIRAVFEQAQRIAPALTPEAFMQAVQAADNAGGVYLEAANTTQEIEQAQGFVVPSQSGPGIRMMPAPPRVSLSRPHQSVRSTSPASPPAYFVAQATGQPIFPRHEIPQGSIPPDQNRDAGQLAGRVGQGDPGTDRSQPERADHGAEQSDRGWADLQGLPVLEAASLQAGLGHITPKIGGEHDVYLDKAHNVAVKLTRPGEFGAEEQGLDGYTSRLQRSNAAFNDNAQIIGQVQFPGESGPRLVHTQPLILADEKRPEPTQREIDVYMRTHGFLRAYDGAYLHETQDLVASDAVPKNFVRTRDGRIHAVDVIVLQPTASQHERLTAQAYNAEQVPADAVPGAPLDAASSKARYDQALTALKALHSHTPALTQNVALVPNRSALNERDFHPKDWADFAGANATEAFFDPRTGQVIVFSDNLVLRPGETQSRALVRAVLHERIGHAGLAALRQMKPKFAERWAKLVAAIEEDPAIADEIAALREQGYDHLDDNQLVEEWFARQVEQMTPQQLQALQPTSILGKLWQWLKDALGDFTWRFKGATQWSPRELKEIMALSHQALQRGGPVGTQQDGRVMQSKVNPFHGSGVPNWLRNQLNLPANAPFRVQALGLRSMLKGSALPKALVPFAQQSQRDIQAIQQRALTLGHDLNAAIEAYAQRTATTVEAAHDLVARAMEEPAILQTLADPVLKERTRVVRNLLDDLSAASAAYAGGELGKTILQNRGHWLRRSYACFDPAANWNYESLEAAAKRGEKIAGQDASKILDAARAYITTNVNAQRASRKEAPATPAEIKAMMIELTDRNTWERNLLGNMTGSGISKDTSSLMKRAAYHPDVAKWMQREGLKEFDYPTVAALKTTGGMYQGRHAPTLLHSARQYLEALHPKASTSDITEMLHQQDIAAPLRALMGEEHNPVKRFITSASFQSQFIARHEQQVAMRDIGLQTGLFSTTKRDFYTEEVGDSKERNGFKIDVTVQTPSGQNVTVQRPIYTTPELAAAMRTAADVPQPLSWENMLPKLWMFLNREAKLNKVALSPDSWISNGVLGNFFMLVQNGDLLTVNGWANLLEAKRTTGSAAAKDGMTLNQAEELLQDSRREMFARLTAAGVADAGLDVAGLNDVLDQRTVQFIQELDVADRVKGAARGAVYGQAALKFLGTPGRAAGAVIGGVIGAKVGNQKIVNGARWIAEQVMAKPDRWAKIATFHGNYAAHQAAGMAEPDAFQLAAEKTLNTMPDYNKLMPWVRNISRLGLGIGPFVGFMHELHRNTFWNARYAVQEMRSGNAALFARGLKRVMGMASIAVIAKYGLPALFSSIFGSGVDDEEKSLRWRRSLGAPWERFGQLIFSRLDSEAASFVNPSYLMPQITLTEVWKGATAGRTWQESWNNAVSALGAQWIQAGIGNNALMRAMGNDDGRGFEITHAEGGMEQFTDKVLYVLAQTMEPALISKENRIANALLDLKPDGREYTVKEELSNILALRGKTYDNQQRVEGKLRDFRQRYESAQSALRAAVRTNAPFGGPQKGFAAAQERVDRLNAEFALWQQDIQALGIDTRAAMKKLSVKATGFKPLEMPQPSKP